MIIGLSGYARSGKDTIAKTLVEEFGFERIAFADPIKKMLIHINPILEDGHRLNELVKEYGWEIAKAKPEVRRLLQALGMAGRGEIDHEVWIIAALRTMDDPEKDYVITDVRFENEAVMVSQMGGEIWRVQRPNVSAVNAHPSESDLDDWDFDYIIDNEGTKADLHNIVSNLLELSR